MRAKTMQLLITSGIALASGIAMPAFALIKILNLLTTQLKPPNMLMEAGLRSRAVGLPLRLIIKRSS